MLDTLSAAQVNLIKAGNVTYKPYVLIDYTGEGDYVELRTNEILQNGLTLHGGVDGESPIGNISTTAVTLATTQLEDVASYDYCGCTMYVYTYIYNRTTDVSVGTPAFLGKFVITDCQWDRKAVTITGVESVVFKLDAPFVYTGSLPVSAVTLLSKIKTAIGAQWIWEPSTLETDLSNIGYSIEKLPDDEGLTNRQMLSYILALIGCNATTSPYSTSNTRFKINYYGTYPSYRQYTLTEATNMVSRTYNNFPCSAKYFTTIATEIEQYTEEGVIKERSVNKSYSNVTIPTNTKHPITAIQNPLWVGHEQTGITKLHALAHNNFHNCSITTLPDIRYEFGDVFSFDDYDQNTAYSIITTWSHSFGGNSTISCTLPSIVTNRVLPQGIKEAIDTAMSTAQSTALANTLINQEIYERGLAIEAEQTARQVAINALQQQLSNASGMYLQTITSGGKSIYLFHDKNDTATWSTTYNQYVFPTSTKVLRLDENGFSISNDGGKTYPYTISSAGDAILNTIYAKGINADYITTGTVSADLIEVTKALADAILAKNITATGTITGAKISGGTITGGTINGTTITANRTKIYDSCEIVGKPSSSTITEGYGVINCSDSATFVGYKYSEDSTPYGITFDDNGIVADADYFEVNSQSGIWLQARGAVTISAPNGLYINSYTAVTSNNTIHSLLNNDTYMHVNTNTGAYGITWWASDAKLKDNIKSTDVCALDKINAIDMVQFDWKSTGEHEDLGLTANQLETIIPNAVFDVEQQDGDTIKQVNTPVVVPYTIKAIQELSTKVEGQQKEIDELKKLVNKLLEK